MCYGRLFLMRRFPAGTYVFSDIERLSKSDRARAQRVRDCLARSPGFCVLNEPQHSWRRFKLLRTLYEQGDNAFNVHRLVDDPQPERFPVFVRGENDHKGARSILLASQAELEKYSTTLDRMWKGRDGMIATEFCDISNGKGIYRKYAAFRIGDRILPRHLFFSESWCVKGWERIDPELLEEERRYIAENPHREFLADIFDQAHIEFGRIDYGVLNGRVQVWEINTNPMLPVNYGGGGPARQALHDAFRPVFVDAMRAVDVGSADAANRVDIERSVVPIWAALGIPVRAVAPRFRRSQYRPAA
jgi:hypothetical protein